MSTAIGYITIRQSHFKEAIGSYSPSFRRCQRSSLPTCHPRQGHHRPHERRPPSPCASCVFVCHPRHDGRASLIYVCDPYPCPSSCDCPSFVVVVSVSVSIT